MLDTNSSGGLGPELSQIQRPKRIRHAIIRENLQIVLRSFGKGRRVFWVLISLAVNPSLCKIIQTTYPRDIWILRLPRTFCCLESCLWHGSSEGSFGCIRFAFRIDPWNHRPWPWWCLRVDILDCKGSPHCRPWSLHWSDPDTRPQSDHYLCMLGRTDFRRSSSNSSLWVGHIANRSLMQLLPSWSCSKMCGGRLSFLPVQMWNVGSDGWRISPRL